MATYNTAFGSLPGYNEQMGTTNTTGGGLDQQTPGAMQYQQRRQRRMQQGGYQQEQQPQQTFAQMQQQGQPRPAPQPGVSTPYQPTGVSQQFQNQLQRQLQGFMAQPSAYNTQAFQQIRGAQAANLQAEYGAQQAAMNEEMARRGLAASSVYSGRYGELAGQQARALSTLDAQLLQQMAQTQGQDRANALKAAQDFAAQQNQQALAAAQLTGQYGGVQTLASQAQQNAQALALAGLTGKYGDQQTLEAQRLADQKALQEAALTGQYGGGKTLEAKQQEYAQSLAMAGLTGKVTTGTGAEATTQLTQEALRNAYDRAAQLSQVTGKQYDVDANTGQITERTGAQTISAQQLGLQKTQAAYQQAAALSEQSGVQYQVDKDGNVVPLLDAKGNPVATSAVSQAELQRKQQADQFTIAQYGTANPTPQQQTLAALQQSSQVKQQAYQQALALSQSSGKQYTVNDRGEVVPLTDGDGNFVATNDAAQAQLNRDMQKDQFTTTSAIQKSQQAYQQALALSEQSGVQYEVNDKGEVVMARGANNQPIPTSAVSQAKLQRDQQQNQFMISQFGVETPAAGAQTLAALQQQLAQAGVTGTFQGQLTQEALQNAYARAAQLSQTTGKQYTVNPNTGAIVEGSASTLAAQLQQAGITGTFQGAITQQRLADAQARAAQLSQITGKQYDVNTATGAITERAGDTLAAQQMTQDKVRNAYAMAQQMSEQSGLQYKPVLDANGNPTGAVEVMKDQQNNPLKTSAATQAQLNRDSQETLAKLDANLRRQLGLSEMTGQMYNINPVTGEATLGANAPSTLAAQQQGYQQAMAQAQYLSSITGNQYKPTYNESTKQWAIGTGTTPERTIDYQNMAAQLTGLFGGQQTLAYKAQDAQAKLAQQTFFSQVAGVLSGLTGDQLRALKEGNYSAPGEPQDGQADESGAWQWSRTQHKWVPNTGGMPSIGNANVNQTYSAPPPPSGNSENQAYSANTTQAAAQTTGKPTYAPSMALNPAELTANRGFQERPASNLLNATSEQMAQFRATAAANAGGQQIGIYNPQAGSDQLQQQVQQRLNAGLRNNITPEQLQQQLGALQQASQAGQVPSWLLPILQQQLMQNYR